jgi:hypothetical protein
MSARRQRAVWAVGAAACAVRPAFRRNVTRSIMQPDALHTAIARCATRSIAGTSRVVRVGRVLRVSEQEILRICAGARSRRQTVPRSYGALFSAGLGQL